MFRRSGLQCCAGDGSADRDAARSRRLARWASAHSRAAWAAVAHARAGAVVAAAEFDNCRTSLGEDRIGLAAAAVAVDQADRRR